MNNIPKVQAKRVSLSGWLLALALLWPLAVWSTTTTLVPLVATWKYLDNGSDQGTAWRTLAFDDSAWVSGPAQLGYGDGDEATVVSFGPDPQNKHLTTYFRRTFIVANVSLYASLKLRLLRDDGAVVYLNGVEIYRSNLPQGAIAYDTEAEASISGDGETAFVESRLSTTATV